MWSHTKWRFYRMASSRDGASADVNYTTPSDVIEEGEVTRP
jgi:hypothetical protein